MLLFYSSSSPYSRKVRITLRELGLAADVREVECNPFSDPADLRAYNRLSKVPTLVAGDLVLYDSPVICEYLIAQADGVGMLPAGGQDRWRVLTGQALADGLLDVAVGMTVERRRPPQEQSASAQARWANQIRDALDAMVEQLPSLPARSTLAHVAFASALGYLDFRYGDLHWRAERPSLGAWYESFRRRDSMVQTEPSDSSYRLG